MSVNRHRPHILVLPEDDANRQIAVGFQLEVAPLALRQMQVLEPARGWLEVLRLFETVHSHEMMRFPERFMALVMDFDGVFEQRFSEATARIPVDLRERVIIVGCRKEPEELKRTEFGSFESLGRALARDCRDGTKKAWDHELLRHNWGEVARFRRPLP